LPQLYMSNELLTSRDWDGIYKEVGFVHDQPEEEIVKLVSLLRESGVNKILDHGCGTGRHTKYLAEQGFFVVGADNSSGAIEMAKGCVKKELSARFVLCDMAEIPVKATPLMP
jgi:2-polyprenyl-3-methyl-5-hydroxy-6-metoxy-1,4-benzoquinol methylase